jgi:hypothetical protein
MSNAVYDGESEILHMYRTGVVTWWISPRWQALFVWDGPSG